MKKNIIIVVSFLIAILIGILAYKYIFSDVLSNFYTTKAYQTQEIDTSIKYYNKALKINSTNTNAINGLIDIYIKQENLNQALSTTESGILANPNNYSLYLKKIKILESDMKILDAVDFVKNIKNEYVISKILDNDILKPKINRESGEYDYSLNIQIESIETANIYYKINSNKYIKYSAPFTLSDGVYTLTVVVISENGQISDELVLEYSINDLSMPVSFSSSNIQIEFSGQNSSLLKIDIANMTEVDLQNTILYDLDIENIKIATKLEKLVLGNVENLTTLEPLSNLKNLKSITILQGANEKLLSDILKISSLKEISITNSNITKLPKNKALLNSLTITNSNILDISNINTYKSLQILNLSNNKIPNITEISKLKKLVYVNLSTNYIVNLSPLKEIISIKELDISYNDITDASDLASLTFLENCNISFNDIISVEPFSLLVYIKSLNVCNNSLLTLQPLEKTTSIEQIYADNNYITDVSYLSTLTNLKYLSINNNNLN